jgi:hypothetical protein
MKQNIKDAPTEHPLLKYTYKKANKAPASSRKDATRVAQLRCGHHHNLQDYRHRFLNPSWTKGGGVTAPPSHFFKLLENDSTD